VRGTLVSMLNLSCEAQWDLILLDHSSPSATRILGQLAPPLYQETSDMIEAAAMSKHGAQDRLVGA
jgi:hypothetical protein